MTIYFEEIVSRISSQIVSCHEGMKRNIILSRASFEDRVIGEALKRRGKLITFISQSERLKLSDVKWDICGYITLDDTLKRLNNWR